jgi:hypothetical protein
MKSENGLLEENCSVITQKNKYTSMISISKNVSKLVLAKTI